MTPTMAIEKRFDIPFTAQQAHREKQIQQVYRPVIGVHKWFARRPGSLFRALLLAEFGDPEYPLKELFFRTNELTGLIIADPFMGGGTPIFEANRTGTSVIGCDINPMAWWVVRQELETLDRAAFLNTAQKVIREIEDRIGGLYRTDCTSCGQEVPVKYFFWVTQQTCATCGRTFDLFPNYTVARNSRHPNYVLYCPHCRKLVETSAPAPTTCPSCLTVIPVRGPARSNRYHCPYCAHEGRYPSEMAAHGPPQHRLFGMEYHCSQCQPAHQGRFFRTADATDEDRYRQAEELLRQNPALPIPDEAIPDGAETRRLHRWGYRHYRELFNARQQLGLGLLANRIRQVDDQEIRYALATVFSDFIRYQNMIARYDAYALKCQDVFSVHGFPVRLVQCENSLLGVPAVGAGGFRHFVQKYDQAKAYCEQPFETSWTPVGKKRISIPGERIAATFVEGPANLETGRRAWLVAGDLGDLDLTNTILDGVFTDPPYFSNVQYAELMDFLYVWLRRVLADVPAFALPSTRSTEELTGNSRQAKGLAHFAQGLSRVFMTTARALRPGGPFVFTYHHNDPVAYTPVAVAILDAALGCTATLPSPAEMGASLHINGTGSSVVDTVFVCRKGITPPACAYVPDYLLTVLLADACALASGGVTPTRGDLTCLALGHLTRLVTIQLAPSWEASRPIATRLQQTQETLMELTDRYALHETVNTTLRQAKPAGHHRQLSFLTEEGMENEP